jgi:hypothetical protein
MTSRVEQDTNVVPESAVVIRLRRDLPAEQVGVEMRQPAGVWASSTTQHQSVRDQRSTLSSDSLRPRIWGIVPHSGRWSDARSIGVWQDLAVPIPDKERRRHLKQQYKWAEHERIEGSLPITVAELEQLTAFVRDVLATEGCDQSARIVRSWAAKYSVEWASLEFALAELGGHCDCEIVANCDPRELFW